MTPEQTAALSRRAVRYLGSAFTECPKTLRKARELGLTGWSFFVAGLGGALGDVSADVVAAALGFIAPEAVRDAWETARRACPVTEIAEQNLGQCERWGRERLGGFAEVDPLIALAQRAVDAADATAMPLYAAWHTMIGTDEAPGARLAVLMNLLRHHRAGAHLLAVRAGGLTPLQAILAGPDREAGAIAFGWQPPYPPFEPLVRRWAWAEALTDRIGAEAFRGLEPAERAEFVRLCGAAMGFAQPLTGEFSQVRSDERAGSAGRVQI